MPSGAGVPSGAGIKALTWEKADAAAGGQGLCARGRARDVVVVRDTWLRARVR